MEIRLGAVRAFILTTVLAACRGTEPGSPEATADAFAEAYFTRADQVRAKQFTAFGATKMLDEELDATRSVRGADFKPSDANLDVTPVRGSRSARGERVRFDYSVKFHGGVEKHADIELARVDGDWKVVRVTIGDAPAPASS